MLFTSKTLKFFITVKKSKPKTKKRVSAISKIKRDKYLAHKETARMLVYARLSHYVNVYKENNYILTYNRVAIRDTKTRWGSCSSKGNLNFNYRLALLPMHLLDYVVVHELSHLKYMNHGREFWGMVATACPDYVACRAELLEIRL